MSRVRAAHAQRDGMRVHDRTAHHGLQRPGLEALARAARRAFFIAGSALLAFVLGVVGVLLFWSYPGKPQPFVGQDGNPLPSSISEKIWVNINGVDHGIIIKSKDIRNPVLLYLHGGMPDYFLNQRYPTTLEDAFTVAWWEQRGAGLSYSPDIPRDSLTVEQFISDTLAVTNYLRDRFGQHKIYLMGHSGGTFFGIQAAARAPELYHAYIGVAQMSNQLKSEKLAYDYMLQQFKATGNTDMVRKLEAAPVTMSGGTPAAYRELRDGAMHSLGIGTMHEMRSVATGLFLESLKNRDYTLPEKINFWRAKNMAGISVLWDVVNATDLAETVREVDVPVYFFSGVYDYTCAYSLSKEYFEQLKAPLKGFYTFEQSAHSPIFEEPARSLRILQDDVLRGTNGLADAP